MHAQVPQLQMLRPHLDGLPELDLPEGYTLSRLRRGWGLFWTRIIAESFEESEEDYAFDKQMRSDLAFSPERILFVVAPDGIPVATASAWFSPAGQESMGILHYVGALKAYQGRRLGYWISLAAMHHMVKEDRTECMLRTDDFRLAAIKTYVRLGFKPWITDDTHPERWHQVFLKLNMAGFAERYGDSTV